MDRIFNFSAGPAMLPQAVLEQVREELLDWQGSGMSVMEMSHRGKDFVGIAERAEADLRELLQVPANYKVLFLQGGASLQFAGVPMNLLRGKTVADYVVTGSWGKKAVKQASAYCDARIIAQPASFTEVPEFASWQHSKDAAYLHITPNETIEGVEYHQLPECGDTPLVGDMSSTFLSRPIDVSQYGLIYAGAQKNIGPAGLTIVIVRDDLIGEVLPQTPAVMDYAEVAAADSMLNTPACFSWYVAGLVFAWLKQQGGLQAMAQINQRKAASLYDYIDESAFYANPVAPANRSWMNVPFTLADEALDGEFLKQAEAAGLSTLKGHRSVGGMRASIYNAMPEAGVAALVAFMKDFAARNG